MRYLILPFIMMTTLCNGQETATHSSKLKSSEQIENSHGKVRINKGFNLRAEVGWNNVWFTSLGVSYLYNQIAAFGSGGYVLYSAFEANWRNTVYYGYKVGGELNGNFIGIAAEFKVNDDFAGSTQFVFTPKAGISLFGYVNLMYGYNVFDRVSNVFGIGENQISLNINGFDFFTKRVTPSY